MKRYWSCPCGNRLERTKQKCVCGKKRPPARVPKHARTLRDDNYETYKTVNATIHSIWDESCGVCNKPRSQERRHDRDHSHHQDDPAFGRPRGLACVSCNRLMPRELTLERSRLITAYLERVEAAYADEDAAPP